MYRVLLSLISLSLVSTAAFGQSAEDYFHRGAQFYIANKKNDSKQAIEAGLQVYPQDPLLNGMAGLLNKEEQDQQTNSSSRSRTSSRRTRRRKNSPASRSRKSRSNNQPRISNSNKSSRDNRTPNHSRKKVSPNSSPGSNNLAPRTSRLNRATRMPPRLPAR